MVPIMLYTRMEETYKVNTSYCGIKLMSLTMKLWERVIE